MWKEKPSDTLTITDAYTFVDREIREGRIVPFSGLGFAILSHDMLNVARWDRECPIVLKNQLYQFTPSSDDEMLFLSDTIRQLDIAEAGCFCIWELGIVAHEREAWKRFLDSQRGDRDKNAYLNDFFLGNL